MTNFSEKSQFRQKNVVKSDICKEGLVEQMTTWNHYFLKSLYLENYWADLHEISVCGAYRGPLQIPNPKFGKNPKNPKLG